MNYQFPNFDGGPYIHPKPESHLPSRIHLNHNMYGYLYAQLSVVWNYSSSPKCYPALYNGSSYLSMMWFKLIYISKRGPGYTIEVW